MTAFLKHEESLLRQAVRESSHERSMFWFWVSGIGVSTAVLSLIIGDPSSLKIWGFGLLLDVYVLQTLAYVHYRDRMLRLINKLSPNQTS